MLNTLRTISRIATLSLIVSTYLLTAFGGLTHELSHRSAHAGRGLEWFAGTSDRDAGVRVETASHSHADAALSGSYCFFCTLGFGTLLVASVTVDFDRVDTVIVEHLADLDPPTVQPLHHPSLRAPPFQG